MSALLDDVAVFHDEDQVRIADGGEPVGDDEAGPSFHQVIHGFLDKHLCPCIHGAGCFIEDQDLRIRQDRTGNRKKLFLSLGYVAGLLIQLHLVSARQGLYKPVDVGRLCRPDHVFVRSVKLSVPDVFHDGAVEKPRVLQHHAEHFPKFAPVEIPDVMAVDADGAAVHVIEPHEQLDHGRLAGAGRTDDGDLLAFLHFRGEVIDDRFVGIISEIHMVKFHISVQAFHGHRIRHGLVLFLFIQELEDALGRSRRELKHIGDLGHLLDRLGEVAHILDKGLDVPHLDGLPDRQESAKDRHAYVSEVSDKLHDRHHHAREKLGFPCRVIEFVIRLVEFPDHVFLFIESFDDVVAAVYLFHLPVYVAEIRLLPAEIPLGVLHHEGDQQDGHRQDQKRHQRHQRADGQHHDQHADQRGHGGDHLGRALVQALPQRIHVVGHPGEHFAHGLRVKIIHRHAADLLRDLFAQPVGRLLGHPGHNDPLDKGAQGAYEIQAQREQKDLPDPAEINAASAGHFAHQAVEDLGGRLSQDLRPYDIENGSADGKHRHEQHMDLKGAHIPDQFPDRPFEIFGFLCAGMSSVHSSRHVQPPPFLHVIPLPRAGTRRSAGRPRSSPAAPGGCRLRRSARHPVR